VEEGNRQLTSSQPYKAEDGTNEIKAASTVKRGNICCSFVRGDQRYCTSNCCHSDGHGLAANKPTPHRSHNPVANPLLLVMLQHNIITRTERFHHASA
jgi:hypothetical protein